MTDEGFKRLAVVEDGIRYHRLREGTVTVGRSRQTDIRLDDSLLSRKHCSITVDGDRLVVADLTSSNGTYVNGDKIAVCEVETGDVIELGSCLLVVLGDTGWNPEGRIESLRNRDRAELVAGLLTEGDSQEPSTDTEDGLPWLEENGRELLTELAADHLADEVVTLLLQRSPEVRQALASALDQLLSKKALERLTDRNSLRREARRLIQQALSESASDGERQP